MPQIELTAGTIDYEDAGTGPVIVLLHGLLMDSSVWRHVIADLRRDHRCVAPTLPLGSHRMPMRADADLTHRRVGDLVAELLTALDLRDVTLVGNDTAIAQFVAVDHPDRLARLVLTSCEAFDNVPPGLPGRVAALTAAVPGAFCAASYAMQSRRLRRLPLTFGWMSKRDVPEDIFLRWMEPVRVNAGVRRDLRKFAKAADPAETTAIAQRLRSFSKPSMIVWAADDRVMPPEHGRRLGELLPDVRVTDIQDSYTLIPEDQPLELAQDIREFIAETPVHQESA